MLLMSYETSNFLPGCRAFFSLCKFAIKLACRTGVIFSRFFVFSGEQKEARRDLCTRSSPTAPEKCEKIAPVLQATIVSVHFKNCFGLILHVVKYSFHH